MKKIFLFASATILFGTLFLASCTKSEDTSTGTPTSSDPRARFLANWSIAENSHDFGTATYYVTIADSSDATHIVFAYLYGDNRKVYATVSGNNFTIPSQTLTGVGHTFSGSGVLSNANRIDMTYLVRTTTTHYDTVTAVLTK